MTTSSGNSISVSTRATHPSDHPHSPSTYSCRFGQFDACSMTRMFTLVIVVLLPRVAHREPNWCPLNLTLTLNHLVIIAVLDDDGLVNLPSSELYAKSKEHATSLSVTLAPAAPLAHCLPRAVGVVPCQTPPQPRFLTLLRRAQCSSLSPGTGRARCLAPRRQWGAGP